MGKSTISTGPFSSSQTVSSLTRPAIRSFLRQRPGIFIGPHRYLKAIRRNFPRTDPAIIPWPIRDSKGHLPIAGPGAPGLKRWEAQRGCPVFTVETVQTWRSVKRQPFADVDVKIYTCKCVYITYGIVYIYILYMYMYDLCMYIINKYMYIICLCYYTHIYI